MLAGIIGRFRHWVAAGLIAGLACGLYWPFLGSPRVFDDWVFFSGQNFSYYATHPFGLGLRLPPYFSLAVTEVEIGGMVAHRIVSLAFHIACALAIYKLIHDLLRLPANRPESAPATNAETLKTTQAADHVWKKSTRISIDIAPVSGQSHNARYLKNSPA